MLPALSKHKEAIRTSIVKLYNENELIADKGRLGLTINIQKYEKSRLGLGNL